MSGGMRKKIFSFGIIMVIIPALLAAGAFLLRGKYYNLLSAAAALLSCIPAFLVFEHGKYGAREISVISVMTAISVAGRLVFAPVPGFKPVSAVVIITGIAFGPEAGFVTGSMSAVVSNFFFGQGPWTPFQMFAWGFIGFVSGLVFRGKQREKPSLWLLAAAGVFGGAVFSLLMDVFTVFSFDGAFSVSRYLFYVSASLPFMTLYAVSNVILLLLAARPLLRKLARLRRKYGAFETDSAGSASASE